ncbi:MAG: DUF4402 domain-containing protein [Ignavibacteriales bacterium]|nr:DUF4402 domain-containing protein [Ignavibacteriales bacterium]
MLIFQISHAQSTGYVAGGASANLITPLSIEAGSGDLDFGDILVSGKASKETIQPKSGKEFIVKGQPNRNISIAFNNVELNNYLWVSNNSGKSGTLKFTPNVVLKNKTKALKSGDNLILQPNGLIGEIKLNVGGSISISPNQPVGDYEGTFTVSVSY